MDSGWAAKVDDPLEFKGGAAFPDYHFPGFSVEAAMWLAERRRPTGIGVDTISLDPGNSATFPVHVDFLATDRFGLGGLNNLGKIPEGSRRPTSGSSRGRRDQAGLPCDRQLVGGRSRRIPGIANNPHGPERVIELRGLEHTWGGDHVDCLRNEAEVERAVGIGARGRADAELEVLRRPREAAGLVGAEAVPGR